MIRSDIGKADLHIHTSEGDGLDSVATILEYVENQTDLEVVAITEHDNLEVSLRARELWAQRRYNFDFITGNEVTTLDGHVVALFLEKPIPSLRRVEETLAAVHAQGGICFIPHPANWLTRSIGPGTLQRVQDRNQDDVWFDGIETANAGPVSRFYRNKAIGLSRKYDIPGVGSSDAHFLQVIGSAYTEFSGSSAQELKSAFQSGQITPQQRAYPGLRDIGIGRSLALPIAGLRATPKSLGWRRTAWSFVGRYIR